MSNIFQPEVQDIGVAGRVKDVAPDTTAAKTIAAVGGTIWEGYKGKQMSDLMDDEGDIEVVPQVLMGQGEKDDKVYGYTKLINQEMGLNQLEEAAAQGQISYSAAERRAQAKAKELINRIPGLAPQIKKRLATFGNGGIGSGGSRPKTEQEALVKGHLEGVKEAGKNGQSPKEYFHSQEQKRNVEEWEAKAKIDKSNAQDMANSTAAKIEWNMANELETVVGQMSTGDLTEQQGHAALQARFTEMAGQYHLAIGAMAIENPEMAGELFEARDKAIERIESYAEYALKMDPLSLRKMALEASRLAAEIKVGSTDAGLMIFAVKQAGGEGPATAVASSYYAKNDEGRKFIQDVYGLDKPESLGDAMKIFGKRLDLYNKTGVVPTATPRSEPEAITGGVADMDMLRQGIDGPVNDAVVGQLIADMPVDRDGLLVEALAAEKEDFLQAKDPQYITEFTNGLVGAISKSIIDSKAEISGLSTITKTMNNRSGTLYDPNKDLINYLMIANKNPKAFDMEQVLAGVQSVAQAYGYPEDILTMHLERAGISVPETSSEATGDENVTKPTPTPKEEPVSTQMPVEEIKQRLARSETGGQEDPFIRTKVIPKEGELGSSAYGPHQITRGLARSVVRYHSDKFDEAELKYLDRFIAQGDRFLKYGRRPDLPGYNARYEYGGAGDLTSPADRKMYDRIATKIIQIELDASGGDIESFIKRWRGADPEGDYLKRFYAELA